MDERACNWDGYRDLIYKSYGSRFQDAPVSFDVRYARRWGRAYRYYLRGWLPEDRSSRILDVACGAGRLLLFYLDCGYREVHGVDISPEQVALARHVTPNVTLANALDYLAQRECEFDLISGLDIIEHFRKDEALHFLDLCYRALRPGGRLLIQTPNGESPFAVSVWFGDFTHEIGFSPNALTRLLALVGFEDIEVREQGPVPFGYSAASTLRWVIWQGIRLSVMVCNLAETGDIGSGVFSRVFLASARRGLHRRYSA